jgi:hypothetical protein
MLIGIPYLGTPTSSLLNQSEFSLLPDIDLLLAFDKYLYNTIPLAKTARPKSNFLFNYQFVLCV